MDRSRDRHPGERAGHGKPSLYPQEQGEAQKGLSRLFV